MMSSCRPGSCSRSRRFLPAAHTFSARATARRGHPGPCPILRRGCRTRHRGSLQAVQRTDPLVEKIRTGKSYMILLTGAQFGLPRTRDSRRSGWSERSSAIRPVACWKTRRLRNEDPFWLEDGWVDIQVQLESAPSSRNCAAGRSTRRSSSTRARRPSSQASRRSRKAIFCHLQIRRRPGWSRPASHHQRRLV